MGAPPMMLRVPEPWHSTCPLSRQSPPRQPMPHHPQTAPAGRDHSDKSRHRDVKRLGLTLRGLAPHPWTVAEVFAPRLEFGARRVRGTPGSISGSASRRADTGHPPPGANPEDGRASARCARSGWA